MTSALDPRLPNGGVSMISPNVRTGSQYYKIGDWVTFAWNFTSVILTPTAVNVVASASSGNAEFTIAANLTYQDNMTVLWDTAQYTTRQGPQLVMATYTLIIENANEAKATGGPLAGELTSSENFLFGMYAPQAYVDYKGEFRYQLYLYMGKY
jgi:hypothetical protein